MDDMDLLGCVLWDLVLTISRSIPYVSNLYTEGEVNLTGRTPVTLSSRLRILRDGQRRSEFKIELQLSDYWRENHGLTRVYIDSYFSQPSFPVVGCNGDRIVRRGELHGRKIVWR